MIQSIYDEREIYFQSIDKGVITVKKRWFTMGIVLVMIFIPVFSAGALAEITIWDGEWTVDHARTILQYLVGKVELTDEDQYWLDQDGDGKLTVADARILLQMLVGKWVPEIEEIDFQLIRYTGTHLNESTLNEIRLPFFVARSLDELLTICKHSESGSFFSYTWSDEDYIEGFDDAFFENNVAFIIYYHEWDYIPLTIVESLTREGNCLTVKLTTGMPRISQPLEASYRVVLAIDRADFAGVQNIRITRAQKNFEDEDLYEFLDWFRNWQDAKNYIKKEGDRF